MEMVQAYCSVEQTLANIRMMKISEGLDLRNLTEISLLPLNYIT